MEALHLPGAQRYVDVGRVAAYPPPPPLIPPPHQQFGPQEQPHYSTTGGHISSFDADPGNYAANQYHHQPPVTALRPTMANPSTSQELYGMDPRNWIDARYSFHHPALLAPFPSTNFDMVARGDPSSSGQQQPRYAAPPQLGPQPIQHGSRLEVVRSHLRHNPMVLAELVMSPESSALVVDLLEEDGGEEMRRRVLDGFVLCAHRVMGNRQGHPVLTALLRSFRGRYAELEIIVTAAAMPNLIWISNDGVTALKILIAEVRWEPQLCAQLAAYLVHEGVMHHYGGDELIAHCFTMMGYHSAAARTLTGHALRAIGDKLESASGPLCLCLRRCLRYVTAEELRRFQDIVFNNAERMAKGQYSNYFVQSVLDHGSDQFRRDLVLRLMKKLVSLSLHRYGNYVVQHCFLNKETGLPKADLLPMVLTACNSLSATDLEKLVLTPPANVVLQRLLNTGCDLNEWRGLALQLAHKTQSIKSRLRKHP